MKFNSSLFPKYSSLTLIEKLLLRTCCYYPPKARRVHVPEDVKDLDRYHNIYEKAFSTQLWDICRNKLVLDLGCGHGGYVLAIAKQGAKMAVGLDIQDDFTFAENESKRLGLTNTRFIHGSTPTFEDNFFDVTISHDSFEHFMNPKSVFQEMVRITKPGGHILIKFGPPWKNPWGRHMSGTIRRDRPWMHLIVPERTLMRVHSVYHNEPVIKEHFNELPGGLNKMTISGFKKILSNQKSCRVVLFEVIPMRKWDILALPIINEYFASGIRAMIVKDESRP